MLFDHHIVAVVNTTKSAAVTVDEELSSFSCIAAYSSLLMASEHQVNSVSSANCLHWGLQT